MKRTAAFIALAASAALIVTGLLLHQHNDVFIKAINICLECIGIG